MRERERGGGVSESGERDFRNNLSTNGVQQNCLRAKKKADEGVKLGLEDASGRSCELYEKLSGRKEKEFKVFTQVRAKSGFNLGLVKQRCFCQVELTT